MTRSVVRKRLKVIGLVLCLMMSALWVFSVLFRAYYVPPNLQWSFVIEYGGILITESQMESAGWTCDFLDSVLRWDMWAQFALLFLGLYLPSMSNGHLVVPVWLLLVAVGFPTAILWWHGRRPKAGFCKVCKYDLTGNVSGTCPECGTAVIPETG